MRNIYQDTTVIKIFTADHGPVQVLSIRKIRIELMRARWK